MSTAAAYAKYCKTEYRWKQQKYDQRKPLTETYQVLGFISSGTYGKVFKARKIGRNPSDEYAIKVKSTDADVQNG
jgi:hypothetical protein